MFSLLYFTQPATIRKRAIKEIKMQDGLQIFWISKRKFCVHVQTINHINYQSVTVTEERRLQGMAWDGTKSWFRNVSKDIKQKAIEQYKLLTLCNV
jgi:hypothetical protein